MSGIPSISSEKCSLTGIILAGGKSERMGADKGLMEWKGKRLVEYSVHALRPICDRIIICTNNDGYSYLGLSIVKDKYTGIGPIGGLHAGLIVSDTDHNIVLSCDMPLVDQDVIELLLTNVLDFQAVVPVIKGHQIGVCAYYHKSVLETLESEIKNNFFKLKLFLQKLRVREILIQDAALQYKLQNINSMEDFRKLTDQS